jgi:hypothetical protein
MSAPIKEFIKAYQYYNTTVYVLPMEIFKQLDIKVWKFNRPPDMTRVEEIRETMKKNNRMDGMINLAYITNEGLVCYEGNHRRLALEGNDFVVFLDILWDVTNEQVTEEFKRLNKSVSVPELYISETDATIRLEIEQFVSEFRKKFKDHESSSTKHSRPNFNRDNLTDQILRLHKELMIPISQVSARLYALNDKYSLRDKSKLSDSIKKKCEKSGLWLFAWSTVICSNEL